MDDSAGAQVLQDANELADVVLANVEVVKSCMVTETELLTVEGQKGAEVTVDGVIEHLIEVVRV